MTKRATADNVPDVDEAAARIAEAAGARKCWRCGCLANSLAAIERHVAEADRPAGLEAALQAARNKLTEIEYDCLGCKVCYPALAVNALDLPAEACADAVAVATRAGWPPLPGAYRVIRYRSPVAVCTLTDEPLAQALADAAPPAAIVGSLQTENLGIERVVLNVVANPHIRFLILCGADTRQQIGHLPGASLLALARCGTNEKGRIIDAPGRRPVLGNLDPAAVAHFRRNVRVIDRVGLADVGALLEAIRTVADADPGCAEPFAVERLVPTVTGRLPQRVQLDPAGYFVVYPDRDRDLLLLEHYRNDGLLDIVVEGRRAGELYTTAIERGLVSRLDHAAYLGCELARAELALRTGESYAQDAAPQRSDAASAAACCGGSPCGDTMS